MRFQKYMPFIFLIGYPICIHIAAIEHIAGIGLMALLLFVLSQLKLSVIKRHPMTSTVMIGAFLSVLGIAFYYNNITPLYFPPIVITLVLAWIFGKTLLPGNEPIITTLARSIYKRYSIEVRQYTRCVTYIWTIFFLLLAVEATVLAIFANIVTWSLFINCLNYIFVAAFFIVEALFRHFYFDRAKSISARELIQSIRSHHFLSFFHEQKDEGIKIPVLSHLRLTDSLFIMPDNKVINVSEFLYDVNRFSDQLPENQYFILTCENTYNFAVAFISALITRKTALLPNNPTENTLKTLLIDYPDSCVIADNDMPNFTTPRNIPAFKPDSIPLVGASHKAAIVFTSGTTGKPTAWAKQWGDLAEHAHQTARGLKLRQRQKVCVLSTVALQHMYGLEHGLILPMQMGLSISIEKPFYPETIRATTEKINRPVVLITTPLHLTVCAELTINNLFFIVSATAPLEPLLANAIEKQCKTEIKEIYGCSELGACATRRTANDKSWRLLSNSKFKLTHSQMYIIRQSFLRSRVTESEIQDNVTLTGKRKFLLLGRKSDNLKIAGKRASLSELNHVLNNIDGVEDGVFFMPNEPDELTTRLSVFVVAPNVSERTILAELRKHIDAVFLPRPLIKLKQIPRNTMGKIPQMELEKLALNYCKVATE